LNEKNRLFIILVVIFPLLVSFKNGFDSRSDYSFYTSPEGILISSNTKSWNEKKLRSLYDELVKNKYGEEIHSLEEIHVFGEPLGTTHTKGSYNSITHTISLFHASKYTKISDYTETLSHEYGHHFAYTHFPAHHFPFSNWIRIRDIDSYTIRWDAFWNYRENHHPLYPQEIFADDYVLLYGPKKITAVEDIYSNEAFYLRTEHENQKISNALENEELHAFLANKTGILVDKERLLKKPIFEAYLDSLLTFQVSAKKNVAYRLNLTVYHSSDHQENYEFYMITNNDEDSQLAFPLNNHKLVNIADAKSITFNVDVVDLSTSFGLHSDTWTLHL